MIDKRKMQPLLDIARMRADLELRRFSAFRANMAGLESRTEQLRSALAREYDREQPFSVAEARFSNLSAGALARNIAKNQEEITRLTPSYEQARSKATREFGRKAVLEQLIAQAAEKDRKSKD